eukprot:5074867-Amphidinium_carterae.1
MFVTSITSTLAATLIEAHERNQDAGHERTQLAIPSILYENESGICWFGQSRSTGSVAGPETPHQ